MFLFDDVIMIPFSIDIRFWQYRTHDGVMDKLSASLALCEGDPSVIYRSNHKRPVMWSFDVFFFVSLHIFLKTNWHQYNTLYTHVTFYHSDVIMSTMASKTTGVSIVCSTVCRGADQRTHQRSLSLAFVRGIHRWPLDSPHKWPVTRKCFRLITSSCASLCASTHLGIWP